MFGPSGSVVIMVPGLSLKLLRTCTGKENFLAKSIARLCITPAPDLRGDFEPPVPPLKPGRDDDLARVQCPPHPIGRNRSNPRLGVRAVGHDADLAPGQADRLESQRIDR